MPHASAANFVRQGVGSSVGTTDPETIDVQDASAFPDPSTDQYDIVIWDAETYNRPDEDPDAEIVTVTSRDTTNNTLTVSRGQQLTNNTSHPNTSDVMITSLSIADYKSVRAQTVSANSSITDPSATSHTGELADLADVFSGSHIDLTNVTSGQHHAQDQSANYKDGGSFEIDAAELAGSSGSADQVLKTDGSAASWGSISGGPTQSDMEDRFDIGDDFADGKLTNRDSSGTTGSTLPSLARVFRPEWQHFSNTNATVSVSSGRLQLQCTGASTADNAGALYTSSLRGGRVEVTFKDVSFTNVGDQFYLGLTDATTPNFEINSSNNQLGYNYDFDTDYLADNNSTSSVQFSTAIDWSVNHDISVVYDRKSRARIFVDGTERASTTTDINVHDYSILVWTSDDNDQTSTMEIEQIEVQIT